MSVKKKPQQSGRKRWGAGLSDTWDDFDDLDFTVPSKKNTNKVIPPIKSNKPASNMFDKENDDEDDFLS